MTRKELKRFKLSDIDVRISIMSGIWRDEYKPDMNVDGKFEIICYDIAHTCVIRIVSEFADIRKNIKRVRKSLKDHKEGRG